MCQKLLNVYVFPDSGFQFMVLGFGFRNQIGLKIKTSPFEQQHLTHRVLAKNNHIFVQHF